jgi:hypothetical protein
VRARRAYHGRVADTRTCEQCGALFTPRREHARFCRPRCRVAWNREHAGDPDTGASALDWSLTALRDAIDCLARGQVLDHAQGFAVISEAVWWVTIVDATLVRYHRHAYKSAMKSQAPARRRAIEGTFAGLRFVRNQMGYHLDPADFIRPEESHPGADRGVTAWTWSPVPEPDLGSLPLRGRAWEMTRYRAYQAQLAGHPIGEIFGQAAAFLQLAAPHPAAA